MADYSLGKAEGEIKVTYDGKGIGQARDDLGRLEKGSGGSLSSTRDGLQQVGTTAGIAGAAIATGIALAVNAAIGFEKQISAIGAVSGATANQMEALRKKALQLGADTAFSASDAALAMEELVKAGLSVEDVLNGAADATVALAAAGQIALPEAAAIASNAMNQFKLAASDLPRIADLIAGAANASAIDVGDFGFALSQAGAVANLAGVSFDDLAAAIALMGNQGIKGSDAGTSLKTMLQNLQPTTKAQIELMKKLGIVTADGSNRFFTQTGELKSLADVAGILNTSLKGMTKAQQLMALETIFGTDAIRAAAVLAGEGAEGFREMAAAMGEVSAQEVAEKRLDNVAGAIEQLKGSTETAAIAFGTALLPAIRTIAEFITNLANKFSELDPRWQKLIAIAAVVGAALLGLVAVIAGVGLAILGIGASLVAIKIAAIIGAIVIAIAAVAFAVKTAYDRSQEFRNLLAQLGQVAKAAFETFLAVARPIGEFIKNQLIPAVKNIVETLIKNLAPAFAAIGEFIQVKVLPAFEKFRTSLEGAMPTIIAIAGFIIGLAKASFDVLGKALGFIIPLFLTLIGPIFSALVAVITFLIGLIPALAEAFKFTVNLVVANVSLLVAYITSSLALMRAIWDKVWGWIVTPVLNAFTWVRETASKAMTETLNKIRDVWNAIVAFFISGRDKVISAINGISAIVTRAREIFAQMKDAAISKAQELLSWMGGLAGKLVGSIGNIGGALFNAGKSLINGFWDGMKSIWNNMVGDLKDKMSSLRGLWPFSPAQWGPFSGRGWVLYSGRALMEGFAEGMDDRIGMVQSAAEQALAAVAGKLPTDFSATVGATTAGAGMSARSGEGSSAGTGSGGSVSNIEINLNVPLEDLRSIKDVQDLLDFIDRLRNDERRGLVTAP